MIDEKITAGTWVRTVVLALTLANELLTAAGRAPLPIGTGEAAQLLSALAAAAASLWAWWKNNSFTRPARLGDAADLQ